MPTKTPASSLVLRTTNGNFARETWIVFYRQLRIALRNPAWVIIGLMQPILYLTLFGPLLEPLASQFGVENAYTIFVPGLLVQLGIFGALFAGFGLVAEWRAGVIEAERVTPASRTALLLGRILRDVLQLLVQGIVLIGLGYAFGLRASVGGMLYGFLLTLLLGASCAAGSNALALITKSEDVMAPLINSIALPILLLSGILLPMTLAPQWLQTVSDFVPIKHIVDAIRAAFVGDFGEPILWGTIWSVVILVVDDDDPAARLGDRRPRGIGAREVDRQGACRRHRTTGDLHRGAERADPARHHHEIYFADPRTTVPAKLKTLIRQPVARR